ncbi:lebercilin [Pantherophis guttatus]|uniref:Lebercilin n=1 Tax=Pantherophis guttatus TaxID=94885 RepID=A0A6P9CWX4_PANGU|nr:lebercilin [Pantherophis guttatus]XP_034287752.1 lebercilin [Pantherophis guttatus]
MEEGGKSVDSEHSRKSDSDKSSNSYYSDDDSTHASDQSPTISSQSIQTVNRSNKIQNLKSHADYHATMQFYSKYAPSKRTRWGFYSQSLTRESPAKDISLVTKRVLSARLLKINELRNELTGLHVKFDELQKENRVLKQLQYRHEKALHKFEDTENVISQFLARHNDEMRILKERLRKTQEREQIAEKKLKASEEELFKVKNSLQKLKKLAEDKNLPERDELAKKLAIAENRLEDSEKKNKEFEKKLDLSNNSFQRQLHSLKKKLYEAQEEKKIIQEEAQGLKQKLKEKERELDAKNIYSNRMLKHSPKKHDDITPRKKVVEKNTVKEVQNTKGVQTTGYFSLLEFPLPPDFISDEIVEKKEDDGHLQLEQPVKDWNEQREDFKQEQNQEREREEKLKNEQELQALEERANKLREEWEKEESDRKKKENSHLFENEKVKMETEVYILEKGTQNHDRTEEERRKKILLAKMREIDREMQNIINTASQELTTDTVTVPYTLEKNKKLQQLSETIEKVSNGLPEPDRFSTVVKEEIQKPQSTDITRTSNDLIFGSYVPSFGKGSGRPSLLNQKIDFLDELTKENVGLDTKKERKPNLMEQLFGSNVNTITPPKRNDFQQDGNTNNGFQAKGTMVNIKNDTDLFFSEGKNFISQRRLQHTANRPAVKALDSLEDDIEEVLLQ